MRLEGKRVVVVGMGRSGVAAARFLASKGARVVGNDAKPESQLSNEAGELTRLGVELSPGGHPEELFLSSDLIVVSPGVPCDSGPLPLARRAGIEVIGEAELASRFISGRLVGVTGSNGKTTTTTLIGELLRAAGARVLVGGNIGIPLISLVEDSTPDTWTVAELSSFQLENATALRVNVAVVTNITPDHLDRHASFEDYVRAKRTILANQTDSDWAVLNGADDAVLDMCRRPDAVSRKVFFSSSGVSDICLRGGRIVTTLLAPGGEETEVLQVDEIPLRGIHNCENVMAALAATFCAMGTGPGELDPLLTAIKEFKGVEHRLEFVAEIGKVRFYNDSKATNVDSTRKALEAFDRNVILILGGKDKGSDYTVLSSLIRERVKRAVLIGAASDKIAEQLHGATRLVRAGSMATAVREAMDAAEPGDTVLLAPACASFDMFENYEHRGRVFKEEVRKLEAKPQAHAESVAEMTSRTD